MFPSINLDDLTPIEMPFAFEGKAYVLREASEGAHCQYRNHIAKVGKLDPATGRPTSYEGLFDVAALLVSLCLFEKDGNKPVRLEAVKAWPKRVVERLYDQAKAVSDIDQPDTPEQVEKQIAALQERLSQLRGEGVEKNGRHSTRPIST